MPQTEYSFRGSESKQGIQFQYKESSKSTICNPKYILELGCLFNKFYVTIKIFSPQ